ncbi:methylmalonyl Co-A mutase-associated GTPase MeaB [Echinicola sp. CAU 1574]|uniref:Methylmalonyl Co-A mutase-associated GTPase MeaB n=1 Tax=Echinicola arenosa TaxID=2774144 RepID=A0ABR9ATH9_9BACT|nr:methylmalonyl Co-A mutase-associated GTPase MeaB [Echinicola arenosa]MBD8491195.1 methylmalonyl Co-A mutase-associated GTPase MeaB [Echinicola arenosa]
MSQASKNRLKASEYVDGLLSRDRSILSKAITLVESKLEKDQKLADEVINRTISYSGKSIRIGITGSPGVGKSTFIEHFGLLLVEKGKRVAVLTIDPSSLASKGSILGDKTRMENLSKKEEVFIRPSPSSQVLGGVGAKTRESILLCEAAGYDVVLVETVGVGQSEIMVTEMVDFFLLLVLPNSGDELQGVKRGIMEMADAIIVTKADRNHLSEATISKKELEHTVKLMKKPNKPWSTEVMLVSAIEQKGLSDIWGLIQRYENQMKAQGFFDLNREEQRVSWFYTHIQQALEAQFYQDKRVKKRLEEQVEEVKKGNSSPLVVARNLVESFLKKQ